MNSPRTEAIIRKCGEIRDHALYELALELEDENARLRGIIVRAAHKFREDKPDATIAAEMVMILQQGNRSFPAPAGS